MRVAVLIPCFNEEAGIAKVASDFRRALPDAAIFVYDNNSTDRTAERAAAAGAKVRQHRVQGKGQVVRRMFADVEAEIYVLVDGDDTYDAAAAPKLIELLVSEQLDLVSAARISANKRAYRFGHRFGNRAFSGLVRLIFGREFDDILSGYKVLSRRFVKTFPATSAGFEIETELTVHSLELDLPCAERPVEYRERPVGSVSKLKTFRDGLKILMLISRLVKDERPLLFFGLIGLADGRDWDRFGIARHHSLSPYGARRRFPTAILAIGLVILGSVSVVTGIILDVVTKTRRETKRLAYLSMPRCDV